MDESPDFDAWWLAHCVALKNAGKDTEAYYARFVMKESLRAAFDAGINYAKEVHYRAH